MGSNLEEEYEIMNILASSGDITGEIADAYFTENKVEHDKKIQNIVDHYLPWMLPIYEKKFTSRKGHFMIGDKLSLADMYFAYFFWVVRKKEPFLESLKTHAPTLSVWAESVLTNELKDWYNGTLGKEWSC